MRTKRISSLSKGANVKPPPIAVKRRTPSAAKAAEAGLKASTARQLALARSGCEEVMKDAEIPVLMQSAATLVVDTLGVEFSDVLELLPDGSGLIMMAGVGWPDGTVGRATMPAGTGSPAGYTLQVGRVVLSEDLRRETRFRPPRLLLEQGITCGMMAPLAWREGPFGVVSAFSRQRRSFSPAEVRFLAGVARILAGAVEHWRKESAWWESEATLRAILDTAVDAVVTTDERGQIKFFNKAAEKLFGFEAAEIIGASVSMLMPSPYREEHAGYIKSYLETGKGRVVGRGRQVIAQRKDGSTFPADLSVSETCLGGRRIFTAIVRDASPRIQREAELSRLNELKSEFVALVSHELKAPLATLVGGLEVLALDASLLPPASRRTLELVHEETARLMGLVDSILDISRLDAGELPLNRREVMLAPLLRRVARRLSCSTRQPLAEIKIKISEPLPMVWADEVYLEQAIRNVLCNAVQFSPSGTPVVVAAAAHGQLVEISITDRGPGISPTEQERVFEPFHRGAGAVGRTTGHGLGLYFARKFIEAQSGAITLRSPAFKRATNPGTTFTILLPIAGG